MTIYKCILVVSAVFQFEEDENEEDTTLGRKKKLFSKECRCYFDYGDTIKVLLINDKKYNILLWVTEMF